MVHLFVCYFSNEHSKFPFVPLLLTAVLFSITFKTFKPTIIHTKASGKVYTKFIADVPIFFFGKLLLNLRCARYNAS